MKKQVPPFITYGKGSALRINVKTSAYRFFHIHVGYSHFVQQLVQLTKNLVGGFILALLFLYWYKQ